MAITVIVKKANKAKAGAFTIKEPTLGELIDALGDLSLDATKAVEKIKALEVELRPYSEKLKAINDRINADQSHLSQDEYVEAGAKYQVRVGRRAQLRNITNMAMVEKKLGKELFRKVLKITLTDLDKYVTADEQKRLGMTETVDGDRKIKIEPKPGVKVTRR